MFDPWRPTGCPATSITNYYSTLRKIPKERRSQDYTDVISHETEICTVTAGRTSHGHLTQSPSWVGGNRLPSWFIGNVFICRNMLISADNVEVCMLVEVSQSCFEMIHSFIILHDIWRLTIAMSGHRTYVHIIVIRPVVHTYRRDCGKANA